MYRTISEVRLHELKSDKLREAIDKATKETDDDDKEGFINVVKDYMKWSEAKTHLALILHVAMIKGELEGTATKFSQVERDGKMYLRIQG